MLRPAHPRLDGNAACGALAEIFGRDMTVARATCRHCGRTGAIAETVAELDDEGVILLCRACGHTLLTWVHVDGRATLAFPGLLGLTWSD